MKEPGKKYGDEDNMLVNDLRSIVSKARSKALLPPIILWWKETGE